MAPSLSVLPQKERVLGSRGPRVVPPEDMTAITVNRDTKAIAKSPNGGEHQIPIPKGTIGYSVCPRENKPTHIYAQLIDPAGNLHSVSIPNCDVDYGAKHGLRVERPRVLVERAIQPLITERARDLAAQAITQMWHSIRDYFDSMKDLGLRKTDLYEEIFNDGAKFRDILNELIASFTPEAWNVIKNGCDIQSLLTISPVNKQYPGYNPAVTVVYILLYPRETKPARNSKEFAKYAGKTMQNPHVRDTAHDGFFKDTRNKTPHYVVARTYGNQHKVMLPMMQLQDATKATIAMAETTVCCLFRTWHPGNLSNEHVVPGVTEAEVPRRRALMKLLRDICDESFKKVGYPLLHRVGCNWGMPLEEGSVKRREWLCYQVTTSEGRGMSVFRTRSIVGLHKGRVGVRVRIPVTFTPLRSWEIRHTLQYIDSPPPVGTPLIISIESMNDGKAHQAPWYRGPRHGAWNNSHELHSFSLRAEWFDDQRGQWFAFSLQSYELFAKRNLQTTSDQYHQSVGGDLSLNYPWVSASRVLQFVHNRRYTNPPPFLAESLNADVKHVIWCHMSQAVRFVPRTQYTDGVPLQRVSFLDNWNAIEKEWPNLYTGEKPPGAMWKCAVCGALTSQKLPSGRKVNCWPITANELDPDEITGLQATAEEVAAETCQVCWVAYRRPCVWVKKEDFTRTPHPNGRETIYTLPDYPGLAPGLYLRSQAIRLPPPLPQNDYYHLEGELEDPDDGADEDPYAIDE